MAGQELCSLRNSARSTKQRRKKNRCPPESCQFSTETTQFGSESLLKMVNSKDNLSIGSNSWKMRPRRSIYLPIGRDHRSRNFGVAIEPSRFQKVLANGLERLHKSNAQPCL